MGALGFARLAALVVVMALVGACGDDSSAGRDALAGRTFLSQTVTGRTLVDGTRITVTFAALELRASAGCNTLSAPYTVRGGTLVVDAARMGMTEMGCTPDRHTQDDWLGGFLQSSPAFTLDGSALTLRSGDTVITFLDRQVADPDRALVGTRWSVDTVIDGDAARSVGNAAAVVIELRADGTLTVTSTGCTSATVPYTGDGDVLRIGTVTVDTIGCPDPWQPTIDVLRAGTVRFTIEAARLTLTAGRAGVAAVAETSVTPSGTTTAPATRPARYADAITAAVDRHLAVSYADVIALRTGAPLTLRLDWFEPQGDTALRRPVIVWIHGGGFFQGTRDDVRDVAEAWARRGFVTATIDYRIDPGSTCMQLDGLTGTERVTEAQRCRDVMVAAMHDAQGAVRWVRANAAALRADPDRVAVGGFSAGALTAVHVAQRADDPGDVGTARGERSTVSAALAASGCSAEPATIGAGDAPVFLLASELDRAVPFACTVATERRMAAVGTPAVTRYYLGESGHALALYRQHRDEIDQLWAAFLIERLRLP